MNKGYLVDVPVKINIWTRVECQKKQFEILKKARPSILFIQSDGGRNEDEWEKIRINRKLIDEGIDWDCTVYKVYEEENKGMYAMFEKVSSLIWEKVDRCIFLEDDLLPSVSFFRYCAELLEKYKDDTRIEVICGNNHLGVSENVNSDYFFSRQGSIWGTATWRRVVQEYNNFNYAKDPYVMKLLEQRTRKNKIAQKRLKAYAKSDKYEGHVPGYEFFFEFNMYAQNRLQIIPKKNLISNIGCSGDSAHFSEINNLPRGVRRIFNMKTYEIEGPIKHAQYVIPDVEYERKRNKIMAYNHPIRNFMRKISRAWLSIIHGDFKGLKKGISRNLGRKNNEN